MKETKQQIMEGVRGVIISKVIAANTVKYWTADKRAVIRLHHTDIITFNPDGSVVLNSGGWKTVTTKERMNTFLPDEYKVWQKNSLWIVWVYDANGPRYAYPFRDGITFYPDGHVTGAGPEPKETLKLKKRVKAYVAGFMATLQAREISQPGGGDCWACLIKNDKGEAVMGDDHILSHLDEGYFVSSLLMNAIDEIPVSQVARAEVGYWLRYHEDHTEWSGDIAAQQVTKSLTRYLYRRVGLAA